VKIPAASDIGVDGSGNLTLKTPAIGATSFASTINLDFSTSTTLSHFHSTTMTGALTFTTSNLAAGLRYDIILTANSGGPYTFTFPGTWIFLGAVAPSGIAASKKATLSLLSTGTTDAGILATYTAQP
jgi:hypothetical protein